MHASANAGETGALCALFGFPESGEFSLENSHFYLDDVRYPAFCAAMQRAHQQGFGGATREEIAAAWREGQAMSGQKHAG